MNLSQALQDPGRLHILRALDLLDRPPAPAFERLTRLVARLLAVPVSLIALVDADRDHFVSSVGLPEPWRSARGTSPGHSFCQYVVADRAPFVVADARAHPRVADSRAMADLGVVAYAGVPLTTPEGHVLGALCAIDHAPRDWSYEEIALLEDLAASVMTNVACLQASSAEQWAAAQQRATEARLVAVLAQVPDAAWSVDRAHRPIGHNPAAAELMQRLGAVAPHLGVGPGERAAHALLPRWQAGYDRALAGETFSAEVNLEGDGASTWYELTFSPIALDGMILGASVIGRDITARRAEALTCLAQENARLYAAERAARLEAEHAAGRISRLYAVTAALAQARTAGQVAEVVVGQGSGALGAYAGALLTRAPDGRLALLQASGYPPDILAGWPSQTETDPYPVADALRAGQPVWLGSLAEGARRYPALPLPPGSPTQALAAIPLLHDGQAVAVIALSFDSPQAFPDEDRAFMLALAEQCAQALERVRLLEALQSELAERQRAEVALRDNEARLDAILHSAMDAIITVDGEQRIVRFNHAAEQLFGYRAEELLGQPLDRLIPARYHSAHHRELPAFGATGATSRLMRVHQPLMALRSTGEEFPIEASISHVEVAGEHWYTAILRDISARLAAEAALKASEARFTAFMDRVPAAAWICGADGVVRYVNGGYAEVFGPQRLAPVGRHLRDQFPPEVADAQLASNLTVLRTNQPLELSPTRPRADGSLGQFLVYKFPLADDDGTPLVGGLAIDITERAAAHEQQRALERSLLETQKLESLGVLAGGIAHDFNNLLTAILGHAELALLDLDAAHPAHASVGQIQVASQRAAELTGQMLAYSGRGRFVVEPVALNPLIEELALLLRASVAKGVTLSYDLAPALPSVEADSAQLRQVLMNLVINGAEAIGGVGRVTVQTRLRRVATDGGQAANELSPPGLPPGPYVAITVADTGCGMDEATLARIFEPFFTTKFTGRGLGLAAVQGIVRAHRGTIQIDSLVGRGTAITVLLPASDAVLRSRQIQPQPNPPSATTVLVIDDETEVRRVAARMLERLGHQVLAAVDASSGLAQLAAHPQIGAVLLDLTMPGLSGQEALQQLRALRADLPVVVMSGYSAQEVSGRLEGFAGVAVLQKPFAPADLRASLSRIYRQAAP